LIDVVDRLLVRWLVIVEEPRSPYFWPTQEERVNIILRHVPGRFAERFRGERFRILEIKRPRADVQGVSIRRVPIGQVRTVPRDRVEAWNIG
jgi:hypothetical protein